LGFQYAATARQLDEHVDEDQVRRLLAALHDDARPGVLKSICAESVVAYLADEIALDGGAVAPRCLSPYTRPKQPRRRLSFPRPTL
jgi:hypothetical protein